MTLGSQDLQCTNEARNLGALLEHSNKITTQEADIVELKNIMLDLKKENNGLRELLDGYENQAKRLNLSVIGIGEESEQEQCPLKFKSNLLVKLLDDESLSKLPEFERCHRALMFKPGLNACYSHLFFASTNFRRGNVSSNWQ